MLPLLWDGKSVPLQQGQTVFLVCCLHHVEKQLKGCLAGGCSTEGFGPASEQTGSQKGV